MSSMTVKMSAILLVWVGLFLLGASGIDISREEYLKYKKYLKSVNKPALKSIKTEYGDIFDCVDIYKQLAFDHPLLKNHTLLMRPASLPKWTNEKSLSDQRTSVPKIGAILGEGCPEGTVPIRRTRMQDLMRAPSLYLYGKKYEENGTYAGNYMLPNNTLPGHHYAIIQATQGTFYGTKVTMDLWTPQVSSNRMFSLAQYWIIGGPVESFNSIESGWMVNSMLFGDQITRLFTYWTVRLKKSLILYIFNHYHRSYHVEKVKVENPAVDVESGEIPTGGKCFCHLYFSPRAHWDPRILVAICQAVRGRFFAWY